jgi:threonine/homoserine/homoserine lactone efflux protein
MAFGYGIGASIVGPELPKNNDVAGAGYIILFLLLLVSGFILTVLTMIARKLLGRSIADRLALRSGLSVAAGVLIAVASEMKPGSNPVLWLLVFLAPIALASPWPGRES